MTAPTAEDLRWLDAAVRYATPWLGTTADNPTVAALVVEPGTQVLLARAVTAKGGRPHAESQALDQAGHAASGMTLYVTLEPCHHWGRTPPCVDAVIRSGIMRVVIGMSDPDPRTSGESVKRLEAAGIEVVVADHEPSKRLHAGHTMRQRAGRPFVTLKLAVSADDKIGNRDKGNLTITGEVARHWTHMQRVLADAVMVGGRTAILDDPKLTVRLPGLEKRTPLRVILVGAEGIDRKVNLIGGFSGHRVAIIAQSDLPLAAVPASIDVIRVPGEDHRPDLSEALKALAAKGVQNLLVEAGAGLTEAFLAAELVDRFELLTSDRIIGDSGLAATATGTIMERLATAGFVPVERQSLGADVLTTFEPGHEGIVALEEAPELPITLRPMTLVSP